jgi:hypothetical protein
MSLKSVSQKLPAERTLTLKDTHTKCRLLYCAVFTGYGIVHQCGEGPVPLTELRGIYMHGPQS